MKVYEETAISVRISPSVESSPNCVLSSLDPATRPDVM